MKCPNLQKARQTVPMKALMKTMFISSVDSMKSGPRLPAGPTGGWDYPERYQTEETTESGRENEQQATPDEQLYEKLCQEQAAFRDELLSLPPKEILDKAWEYLVREDILVAMEYNELDDVHAQALLDLPDSMSDLCGVATEKDSHQQESI